MIGRRAFVLGGISLPCGVGLGLWVHAANRSHASIRLIGDNDGILALLDTGHERVLMLTGSISDYLWNQLPILRTLGRSRIDLLIGSYENLLPRSVRDDVGEALAISLQRDASLPPLAGDVQIVSDYSEIALGDHAKITLQLSGANSDFVVSCDVADTSVVLVSSTSAMRLIEETGMYALIVPGEFVSEDISLNHASLIIGASDPPMNLEQPYLQIFPTSVTSITPHDGGISVPQDQLSS